MTLKTVILRQDWHLQANGLFASESPLLNDAAFYGFFYAEPFHLSETVGMVSTR